MLTLNYPYWYIIFCVLLGIGCAYLLYRKDKTFGEDLKWLTPVLGLLRFLSVTLLALFLLEPLIQTEDKIIEKPIIVIAQDNSESIGLAKDSLFYRGEYKKKLIELKERLAEKYEVTDFNFGDAVADSLSFNYSKKQTDISSLFKTVEDKFYGRNLGGLILATDGIFNKGINPVYASKGLENASVYTIAMGDTTVRKDLIVSSVQNNDLAYKGNEFPVEISLKANFLKGESAKVSIWKGNKKLKENIVSFGTTNEAVSTNFLLPANTSGKQKYTVRVTEFENELTLINNKKDFYINVIENKQNILLLSEAPHPDISVLKSVIEKNKNYAISVQLIKVFKEKLEKYSLIILHGIPTTKRSDSQLLTRILNTKIPILICATEQTNYAKINQLKQQLTLIGNNGFSTAKGSLNASFNKFTISNELKNNLSDFPPLQVPFASGYKVAKTNNVFLHQKINGTKTNYPLFAFNEKDGQKVGFLLGEGIWRWKLLDYLKNDNNDNFNELIQKPIQYLVAKKDKSQFRVSNKDLVLENEQLIIDAELYNESYELVNDAEVEIKIINEKGEEYPSKIMSKAGNGYRLNVGMFKSGQYSYTATTSFDGKRLEKKGEFSVKALQVEYLNLVANHGLLYELSNTTNGKLFYPNQLEALEKEIYKQENIVPVSYTKQSVEDLIKLKWIFGIIILLLGVEWFLRKRNGGY